MATQRLSQEQRRQYTQELLLKTALECFVSKGYGGCSIDHIAAEAGYSKGAFYAYFKNKEDIFFAAFSARAKAQFEVMKGNVQSEDILQKSVDSRRMKRAGFDLSPDKWVILVLEFLLHAQRQPLAKRRLRKFMRENRLMMADILRRRLDPEGKMKPEEIQQLALKQQIVDLGFSALHLVEKDLTLETYGEMMRGLLRNQSTR